MAVWHDTYWVLHTVLIMHKHQVAPDHSSFTAPKVCAWLGEAKLINYTTQSYDSLSLFPLDEFERIIVASNCRMVRPRPSLFVSRLLKLSSQQRQSALLTATTKRKKNTPIICLLLVPWTQAPAAQLQSFLLSRRTLKSWKTAREEGGGIMLGTVFFSPIQWPQMRTLRHVFQTITTQ